MVIVSDDFPGLSHAIKNLFPQTDHQLCFLHMQRNIKKNMSKQDAKQFYEELSLIKKINDYEKAVMKFEELCKAYEKKYPAYIKGLLNKKNKNLYGLRLNLCLESYGVNRKKISNGEIILK